MHPTAWHCAALRCAAPHCTALHSEPDIQLDASFLQQLRLCFAAWQRDRCIQHQLSTANRQASGQTGRRACTGQGCTPCLSVGNAWGTHGVMHASAHHGVSHRCHWTLVARAGLITHFTLVEAVDVEWMHSSQA
jgi:hypothetical protein